MFSSNWVFLVSRECSGKTSIKEDVFSFLNPWRGYFASLLLWVQCISNKINISENIFKKKTGNVAIFPV